MGTRLFLAIIVILVVLIIIPDFNEILTSLIEDLLIDGFGLTGYQKAWWHLFPLIVFGYLLIVLPLQIIIGRARGSDKDSYEGDE